MRDVLAIAVARSGNEKIGDCATTYAAQASCPSSCVFFNGGGCYAENGRIYTSSTEPLNRAAASVSATALDVAKEEAAAISHLPVVTCDARPLRLHTVGDCRTDEAARIVAAAAAEYMRRGGGPVWTYTHGWRTVDRASWGPVSVLASCETPEQVELARARGYATAVVVEEFESRRLYEIGGGDAPSARVEASPPSSCRTAPVSRPVAADNTGSPQSPSGPRRVTGQRPGSASAPVTSARILPCPAQTTDGVTCSSCRLCMDDARLRAAGYSIGFAVHGTALTTKKAVESLRAPGDEARRLTSRDFIRSFLAATDGRWPSSREVMDGARVTRASAIEMLDRLRAEHTNREEARV